MADDTTTALLVTAQSYLNTTKTQIQGTIAPLLTSAYWNLSALSSYITQLSDGARGPADNYLRAAMDNIAGSSTWLATQTTAQLDQVKSTVQAGINAHAQDVQAAIKSAAIDVESLITRISDNTAGFINSAVSGIVDNLYNVQDTITRLTAGGYTLMRDALGDLLDRIPAAVWGYLDKWMSEEVR